MWRSAAARALSPRSLNGRKILENGDYAACRAVIGNEKQSSGPRSRRLISPSKRAASTEHAERYGLSGTQRGPDAKRRVRRLPHCNAVPDVDYRARI
jgi:hypothetical protein